MMDDLTLFDSPAADAQQHTPPTSTHAHTGSSCAFCATQPTGKAAAEAAMKAAADARQEWIARADEWLRLQPQGTVLTADDLVAAVGLPLGAIAMAGNNAMGALFRSWARQGLIYAVGFTQATRKSSHGGILRVWKVL